jgi:hypothetical protein
MEGTEAIPTHNPDRGRGVRADGVKAERRRRKGGTLNRMAQMKLDIFEPSQLDMRNYVYRWVNDEGGRLRMATQADDYDFVKGSEIKGFNAGATDSEGGETVRMLTGTDKNGNAVYSYLVKKPREYFEEDMEQAVTAREDMMKGIVYRGEVDGLEEHGDVSSLKENVYVPEGNQLGGAAQRRRGPLPRKA